MAVDWGRKHMNLDGITAIGVDEIQWRRGHKYLTLVYQINENCKRLLWVGKDRKVKTLLRFSTSTAVFMFIPKQKEPGLAPRLGSWTQINSTIRKRGRSPAGTRTHLPRAGRLRSESV